MIRDKFKKKSDKQTETDTIKLVEEPTALDEQFTSPSSALSQPDDENGQLEKNLDDLKIELEQEKEKRLRLQAEFENFRKRTANEFSQIIRSAGERLIKQILPVIDDFERLFDHSDEKSDREALLKGIELIQQKFEAILTAEGLQPIKALGEPFDSEIHEAFSQIEDSEHPHGTVINEIQKGYRLGDRIIRFSKVIVSKTPEKPQDLEEKTDE